ncbi:sulfatase-like hydrolase/transferase [Microbulbifer thermotolerans]|uniref:sulfatase-like hydrolase/transferase n=1 Tax=Microbulbifer thermotolerans TaxID=252514 RepID=UPI002670F364|nr:sulfatase-like hydrolase/transferase [Microbulbifer thermotolerans]WKT59382.1 sulfatase-like hydrolase/transferase [Microbulbifer thermotolerans]
MIRLRAILIMAITCIAISKNALAVQEAREKENVKRENVLILMFDDMRFDTFSYRGGPVATPNIDQLAEQSVRFDNAMTTTGLCSPSRAALFTGRWGHRTGLDDNVGLYHSRLSELSLSEQGLIGRAKKAGYFVGYVGKWHLGPQGVKLRGADYVAEVKESKWSRAMRPLTPYGIAVNIDRYNAYRLNTDRGQVDYFQEKVEYYQTLPGSYEDTPTYAKVRAAREMLRIAAKEERPFFGVISFDQPHPPYRVPEPYASMFDPEKLELPANHLAKRVNKPMSQEDAFWPWHDVGHMTDKDWLKMRAYYYGAMAMIDRAVGEVLETAKEVGIYDDLHIVFLGDQGSMLGEHGLYDKGPYAYDELMRMPLMIRNPEVEPKSVLRQVSMLDIAPTLAEIMALPDDGVQDGRSLNPLIEQGDNAEKGRKDIALYAYEWYNGAWFGIRALRTPELKFVWNPGDIRDELYDLSKDPVEINNQVDNPKYRKKLLHMVSLMCEQLEASQDPMLEKFNAQMNHYSELEGRENSVIN